MSKIYFGRFLRSWTTSKPEQHLWNDCFFQLTTPILSPEGGPLEVPPPTTDTLNCTAHYTLEVLHTTLEVLHTTL